MENILLDEREEFEAKLDMSEYLGSFFNPEAARKAKAARNAERFESSENVEEQMQNKEDLFNDPVVQAIGKSLKQNANNINKDSDVSKFDIQSPLHKLIRD